MNISHNLKIISLNVLRKPSPWVLGCPFSSPSALSWGMCPKPRTYIPSPYSWVHASACKSGRHLTLTTAKQNSPPPNPRWSSPAQQMSAHIWHYFWNFSFHSHKSNLRVRPVDTTSKTYQNSSRFYAHHCTSPVVLKQGWFCPLGTFGNI